MNAHVIRCRQTGQPLAVLYGGGTCVCPPGECRDAAHDGISAEEKKARAEAIADAKARERREAAE